MIYILYYFSIGFINQRPFQTFQLNILSTCKQRLQCLGRSLVKKRNWYGDKGDLLRRILWKLTDTPGHFDASLSFLVLFFLDFGRPLVFFYIWRSYFMLMTICILDNFKSWLLSELVTDVLPINLFNPLFSTDVPM